MTEHAALFEQFFMPASGAGESKGNQGIVSMSRFLFSGAKVMHAAPDRISLG